MSDVGDESDDGSQMDTNVHYLHSAELRLDLGSEETAEIIRRTLAVDKEPSRSNSQRQLAVDGKDLLISVRSVDRRCLQKSIANLLDMCELAKSTIDMVDAKKWTIPVCPNKKSKLS